MHLSQPKLYTRKTELALEIKFYPYFHRVTRPWLTDTQKRKDVKYASRGVHVPEIYTAHDSRAILKCY